MDSSSLSLEGKVALVTGGSRGIGRETALQFASAGADVVVAGLDLPDRQNVAAEVKALGRNSLALEVDLTNSEQIFATVARATTKIGAIDILVNNAGMGLTERFMEGKTEIWAKLLSLNLLGHIVVTRAVLEGMIERKSGKIINIASDAGRAGSSGQVVYGATKGGMIAFTRNLAVEMSRYKININCVSPGLIDTVMWNHTRQVTPKLAEAYEKTIPWKRLGTSAEIASAILFLASDMADYITGQILSVNGGVFIGG